MEKLIKFSTVFSSCYTSVYPFSPNASHLNHSIGNTIGLNYSTNYYDDAKSSYLLTNLYPNKPRFKNRCHIILNPLATNSSHFNYLKTVNSINFNSIFITECHVRLKEDISNCLVELVRNNSYYFLTLTGASVSLGLGFRNGTNYALKWVREGYNKYGQPKLQWQIPLDHPGQDRQSCYYFSTIASKNGLYPALYEGKDSKGVHLRQPHPFFVLFMKRVAIHLTGQIGLSCGFILGRDGCETRYEKLAHNWWITTKKRLKDVYFHDKNITLEPNKNCIYERRSKSITDNPKCLRYYDRVFIIAALWDDNYHHFLIDSLSRLAHSLPFLLSNPDIMIHIRAYENVRATNLKVDNNKDKLAYISSSIDMRNKVFSLLGIKSSRIISGYAKDSPLGDTILAGNVYFPRQIRCAFPLSSAEEILSLSRILLYNSYKMIGLEWSPGVQMKNKRLILLQRYTDLEGSSRDWTNRTFNIVLQAFSKVFSEHQIVPIRSNDPHYMKCFDCAVREFSGADVLVGAHGAGLTNMIFMPQNSLIVEMTGEWDMRMLPVCGYTGPLCAACGHHHYIHYFDWNDQIYTYGNVSLLRQQKIPTGCI